MSLKSKKLHKADLKNDFESSDSDYSLETQRNTYCVLLHVLEGVNFNQKGEGDIGQKRKIILTATLNGVKFEIEGHCTETTTVFNSNCVWECDLNDIKRMKCDNRPVKIECFLISHASTKYKFIGSLLLPIRGLQIHNTLTNVQLKLLWHKLGAPTSEWRQLKPEIYLLLTIVKKNLVATGQLDALLGKKSSPKNDIAVSETAAMLQSQSNVYVQLLDQVGLIQVGNNPDIDCDIFNITITFKHVRNLSKLVDGGAGDRLQNNQPANKVVFHYDFLGSNSEFDILFNPNDCYPINEKITLSFKSSLRSLRTYFERIFYIPINLLINGLAIANFCLNIAHLMPDDSYFSLNQIWTKNASFHFDRMHKVLSPHALRPSVDYIFTIKQVTFYAKNTSYRMDVINSNESLMAFPPQPTSLNPIIFHSGVGVGVGVEVEPIEQVGSGSNRTGSYAIGPNFNWMYENKSPIRTETDPLSSRRSPETEWLCELSNLLPPPRQMHKILVETGTDPIFNLPKVNASTEVEQKFYNMIGINTEKVQTCDASCGTLEELHLKSSSPPDVDQLTLKIVQELEEWKSQQMNQFLCELGRKELEVRNQWEYEWEQKTKNLERKLEEKIEKYDNLKKKLETTQMEYEANQMRKREQFQIAEKVRHEITEFYEGKFAVLESQMNRLTQEVEQRGYAADIKNQEIQEKNLELERERAEAKERIRELEKQLISMEKAHLTSDQLKDVLYNLNQQNKRFVEVEKSKNYFKDQWAKSVREMNKLKLCVLEQQEKLINDKTNKSIDIFIDEILKDEKDALESDRGELKSIKDELLFTSSDEETLTGPH